MTMMKCERSGKEIRLAQGVFVSTPEDGGTRRWKFMSPDVADRTTDYAVPVKAMAKSPEALVAWISHLNEKSWFDANDFADFCTELGRRNSDIFNAM